MLVDGFDKLWSLLGPSAGAIGTILAVVGVGVLVIAILGWAWQRRKGAVSIGGFPWMAVIIGAVMAGPKVLFPVILGIGDALINVVKLVVTWVTGQF